MSSSNYYELSIAPSSEDHIQGSLDAPIVLVEYGDYQCPYCGQAFPIVKQLQEDFGDNMAYIFRHFPLAQMHEHALHAAEAAELASDEGKFWEMHDMIYENQHSIDDISLTTMAKSLGMDEKKFMINLATDSKKDEVQADFMSGVESGVNGTPSFYINGKKYEGSWDYHEFSKVLKSVLI